MCHKHKADQFLLKASVYYEIAYSFALLCKRKKSCADNLLLQFKDFESLIFWVRQSSILHSSVLWNGHGPPPKYFLYLKASLVFIFFCRWHVFCKRFFLLCRFQISLIDRF